MSHTLRCQTQRREEFQDITALVQDAVSRQALRNGAVLVSSPHTTAGITVNEGADPDVKRDMLVCLRRLVPETGDYRHAEGNSDAHVKTSMMGNSLLLPVENGRLVLGTWQAVYLCEFDGPRTRSVRVDFLQGASDEG